MITSVHRVFAVLEAIGTAARPLSNKEIADAIGSAPSSSLALLRSMVETGYLSFDPITKHYSVTLRLLLLAEGFGATLISSGLRSVLRAVHDETGETVSLSIQNGFEMVVLDSMLGRFPIISNLPAGVRVGVARSGIGLAALAAQGDERMIERALDRIDTPGEREQARTLIESAREKGYLVAHDLWFEGHGVVAVPVQLPDSGEIVVIGVGGPSQRITRNADAMLNACSGAVGRYLRTPS
jgi:DNA-binding IclR family transcriptional regulator